MCAKLANDIRRQQIDAIIRGNSYPTAGELARKFAVTIRTIHRDLDALEKRGAKLKFSKIHGGYYHTVRSWGLPALNITDTDLYALTIARQALALYDGIPLADDLKCFYEKITRHLTSKVSTRPEYMEELSGITFLRMPALPVKTAVWAGVVKGLREKKFIDITMDSRSSPWQIAPNRIVNLEGDWYLFAEDTDFEMHQIMMAQIQKVRVTEVDFEPDPRFDSEKLFANIFGRFPQSGDLQLTRVHIDKEMAPRVEERKWHSKQTIRKFENGDIEIAFSASAVGPDPFFNIKAWVLSWGRHAHVLEPEALKKSVAAEIEALRNNEMRSQCTT